MSTFPVLHTERFILRQLKQEDARVLFKYFSLDEVTEFYDLESFKKLVQAEQLIDRWNERFVNDEDIRWAITLKSEDRVIGTCGFHNWMKEHDKAEIGYELAPE